MLGVAAHGEQAAMDLRVQRLHPAVHHLGEAGDLGDVVTLRPASRKRLGGAAGRDELDALVAQRPGEIDEPRLVADREQRAGNLLHGGLGGNLTAARYHESPGSCVRISHAALRRRGFRQPPPAPAVRSMLQRDLHVPLGPE